MLTSFTLPPERRRKDASAFHFPTSSEFSSLAGMKAEFSLSLLRREDLVALGFSFSSILLLLPAAWLHCLCAPATAEHLLRPRRTCCSANQHNVLVTLLTKPYGCKWCSCESFPAGQLNEDQWKLLLGGSVYFSSCSLHKH